MTTTKEPDKQVESRKPTGKAATWFKKGVSGNPKGRPKRGESLRETILAHLNRLHPEGKDLSKRQYGKAVQMTRLQVLLIKLEEDDPKTLLAYGFGKPIETHEIQSTDGTSVAMTLRIAAGAIPQMKDEANNGNGNGAAEKPRQEAGK